MKRNLYESILIVFSALAGGLASNITTATFEISHSSPLWFITLFFVLQVVVFTAVVMGIVSFIHWRFEGE